MRHLYMLFVHALAMIARLVGPGGLRSMVAESVLVKHRVLILNRSHQRAHNLRASDRFVAGQRTLPKYLSSDHDPLFRSAQWQADLRILEIGEIKTVPYVPLSHPFVERLIGIVRREFLDRTLFWTTADPENKLLEFRDYNNGFRAHKSFRGRTPDQEMRALRLRDVLVVTG